MTYPQIVEYQDAVQNPRAFSDAELQAGSIKTTPLGLPLALSGGFALTYTVTRGSRKIAVRCFHKEVPGAEQRYAKISTKLRSLQNSYFVNFDYQRDGIKVRTQRYPIIKMDWVEGETLSVYLSRMAADPSRVADLRERFFALSEYLKLHDIAHGDIQNENVMVSNGALRLIDYDGMFVPGMVEGQGTEVGHKHFQHPERTTAMFGPHMDRFSFIVLDVSLEALQANPALHTKYREGGNAIIFNANDFASPSSSEVFGVLGSMPSLAESARKLAAVCKAGSTDVPTLADFRAGKNIPVPTVPATSAKRVQKQVTYIGAFDVLNGSNFDEVLKRVGDKIEVVGKIVSIKEGVGRRGRGKGLPYVFINFGPWNRHSVKITIWSEGLGNLSNTPNSSWIGKWVSVTGLIDPRYDGAHYGKPYSNVGITVITDDQIVLLKEQEAQFRLGLHKRIVVSGGSETESAQETRSNNQGVLDGIKHGKTQPSFRKARPNQPSSSGTKNQQILLKIGVGAGATGNNQPTTPPTRIPTPSPPSSTSLLSEIPLWVWAIVIFVVMMVISGLSK